MIVLDYLKKLKNNQIIIPPFHTGHLGLLPDTQVKLGIFSPYVSDPSHCELIISPYDPTRELAILRCTMRDKIGVVKKLVDALSSLRINIISEESSAIDHQSYHTLNLLIDISRADFDGKKTHNWTINKFNRYSYVLPLNDERYVKIFETVIAFCGDAILWKSVAGEKRIQLYVSPLETTSLQNNSVSKVSTTGKGHVVSIELNEDVINSIKEILQCPPNQEDSLSYILLSDTKERKLRVYFPKLKTVSKLIHIGMHHKDTSGALSSIFDLLARSNFNIITGLLRKKSATDSVWEGIIEYKGIEDDIPHTDDHSVYQWVVNKITQNLHSEYDINRYKIQVGNPLYPKLRNGQKDIKIPINTGKNIKKSLYETFDIHDRIANSLSNLDEDENTHLLKDLLDIISARNKGSFQPRIFISYPSSAKSHIKLIKSMLKNDFYLDEYQEPDGDIILDKVVKKIKSCDFFLGVWHHEDKMPVGDGMFGISPWMPFELGIALSEAKKYLVIRSNKLDESVWKRINPGKAIPDYNDLEFKSKTLNMINSYLVDFRQKNS